MNEQIFKICPTLGMYHYKGMHGVNMGMGTDPYEEYRKFYKQHSKDIDKEAVIYSEISNNRKKMGGDKKIHNI